MKTPSTLQAWQIQIVFGLVLSAFGLLTGLSLHDAFLGILGAISLAVTLNIYIKHRNKKPRMRR